LALEKSIGLRSLLIRIGELGVIVPDVLIVFIRLIESVKLNLALIF